MLTYADVCGRMLTDTVCRTAGKMEIKRSNSWNKLKAAVATGKVHDTAMRSTGIRVFVFYLCIYLFSFPAVAGKLHETEMRATGICFFVDSFPPVV